MRIKLKWFLTGNVSELVESDQLLGPQTTILEVKGLIQIQYGFLPKETLLIHNHLLDNNATLGSIGIVNQSAADSVVITAHVVRSSDLEKANALDDEVEEENDTGIHEFTHQEFEMAMRMLGRDVPISTERLKEVRQDAPRTRPAFLNAVKKDNVNQRPGGHRDGVVEQEVPQHQQQHEQTSVVGHPATSQSYQPKESQVHRIFKLSMYGLRKEGVENEYQIVFPSAAEPFQFWDMRLPEDELHQEQWCTQNEVCFELFFFGDFKPLKSPLAMSQFAALVQQMLGTKLGIKANVKPQIREAGCMYPLIAVPVILTETEAMELGNVVFEKFGTFAPSTEEAYAGGEPPGSSSGGGACKAQ